MTESLGQSSSHRIGSTLEDELRQKIEHLWQRQRPSVFERLQTLDRILSSDIPSATERETALRVAHNFAGSLGMYGFHVAGGIAREFESELLAPAPDTTLLSSLVARLRASLGM